MMDQEEKNLEQMLKHGARDPGENPWFTRRVLNKLPDKPKRDRAWASPVLYTLALVVCCLCWGMLLKAQDFSVITVRDLLYHALMAAVTIMVLVQDIAAFIRITDN